MATSQTLERAEPAREELDTGYWARRAVLVLRLALGLLWASNLAWKLPPGFGNLRQYVVDASTHQVFAPFAWVMSHAVLPHFIAFAWLTLIVETLLAVLLLAGLLTRLAAVLALGQGAAIALSVLNTPNEWPWSYFLMAVAHLTVLAFAAGRVGGLDGLLRPQWRVSSSRLAAFAMRAS